MNTLSTGMPSTLGSYLKLCSVFFGDDSPQVKFINDKIASNPNGADEEVIAEESQMMFLLFNIDNPDKLSMDEIL